MLPDLVTGFPRVFRVGVPVLATGLTTPNVVVNSAAIRVGAIFDAPSAISMTGFRLGISAVAGTTTNTLRGDLFACDAALRPTGASLAGVTVAAALAVGFTEYSFAAPFTLTAGATYAIVIRNANATPATNSFTVNNTVGAGVQFDRLHIHSTDTGTTWYGDGSYEANTFIAPVYATVGLYASLTAPSWTASAGSTTHPLFNTSGSRVARVGMRVRFPCRFRVWKIVTGLSKSGTPVFDLRGEICSTTAVLSTSPDVWNTAPLPTTGHARAAWSWNSPLTLDADTDYYLSIVCEGATAGTAANFARVPGIAVAATGVIRPALIGPAYDTHFSTGTTIAWAQSASQLLGIQALVEMVDPIPTGGGVSRGVFSGGIFN